MAFSCQFRLSNLAFLFTFNQLYQIHAFLISYNTFMKLLYSLISSTGDGGPSTEAADGDARVTRAQGKATNLGT
jgi:hypothetical protein